VTSPHLDKASKNDILNYMKESGYKRDAIFNQLEERVSMNRQIKGQEL